MDIPKKMIGMAKIDRVSKKFIDLCEEEEMDEIEMLSCTSTIQIIMYTVIFSKIEPVEKFAERAKTAIVECYEIHKRGQHG